MRITTKYSKVESITYSFDESDIKRALLSHFDIKVPVSHGISWVLWDSEIDQAGDVVGGGGAEIVIEFREPVENERCNNKS